MVFLWVQGCVSESMMRGFEEALTAKLDRSREERSLMDSQVVNEDKTKETTTASEVILIVVGFVHDSRYESDGVTPQP